jgi:hypothetical protein
MGSGEPMERASAAPVVLVVPVNLASMMLGTPVAAPVVVAAAGDGSAAAAAAAAPPTAS